MNDEFYIGWQSQAPPRTGASVRRVVMAMLAVAAVLAVVLPLAQRTIGAGVFEWGRVKPFSGILKSEPYPRLLVPRPGAKGAPAAFSSYYLVNPLKFGFDAETARQLDGQEVGL